MPTNDEQDGDILDGGLELRRKRQPRQFPTIVPETPTLVFGSTLRPTSRTRQPRCAVTRGGQARGAGAAKPASAAGLAAYLEALRADGGDAQAVAADDTSVTVATWHAAKGLEWPIVVLFELWSEPRASALGVHVVSERPAFELDDPLAGRSIRYWPSPYHPSQYSGQLEAYAGILEAATGHRLVARFIHLPLPGAIVELGPR